MATTRAHAYIDRPADEVWAEIGDPAAISRWFPGVKACEVSGDVRTVGTDSGAVVKERIIINDDSLRRFQYSIIEMEPFEHHVATVDVLELDGRTTMVVYSADVKPDQLRGSMQDSVAGAVAGLKRFLEADHNG